MNGSAASRVPEDVSPKSQTAANQSDRLSAFWTYG